MQASSGLAMALIRQALPEANAVVLNAVLGASWQLNVQLAAVLQRGARTYCSTGGLASGPLNHPSSSNSGSHCAQLPQSSCMGQRHVSSQAASSSQQQHPSSAAQADEPIEVIRARVFEHHVGNNKRSGRRPLLKALRGDWIADWYFLPDPNLPLVENFNEADRLERVGLRKAAGKAPPKKGQGKRAGGKKR